MCKFSQEKINELFINLPEYYRKPEVACYKGIYGFILKGLRRKQISLDWNCIPHTSHTFKKSVNKLITNHPIDTISWRNINEYTDFEWDNNRLYVSSIDLKTDCPEVVWQVGCLVFQAVKRALIKRFPKKKLVVLFIFNRNEEDKWYESKIMFHSIRKFDKGFHEPCDTYFDAGLNANKLEIITPSKIEYVNDDFAELEGLN
jgi:hypothetical protein